MPWGLWFALVLGELHEIARRKTFNKWNGWYPRAKVPTLTTGSLQMKKFIWITVAVALGLGLTMVYKRHTESEKEKAKEAALTKFARDFCNGIDTKFIVALRESKKARIKAYTIASEVKRDMRKDSADGRLAAELDVSINASINAVYRAKETETVESTLNIARYTCTTELTKLYTKKAPQ